MRRVGTTKELPVRAWFIAATNRNVEDLVAKGEFRSDLYYRLNVLSIEMPPLRTRGNDIIIRYDDSTEQWSHIYTTPENVKALTFVSAGEAYYTTCWGHGRWDGGSWSYKHEFDFCDISDIWGIRDVAGDLHLYTVGNNNFSNGIRVWKYTENASPALLGTFGSKCGFVFGDPDDGSFICNGVDHIGTASGIWGSAAGDVYVTGRLGPGADPGSGRIYRYDGVTWSHLTDFGDIPGVMDAWGSGPYDIWFSLQDGRLLHYGSTF